MPALWFFTLGEEGVERIRGLRDTELLKRGFGGGIGGGLRDARSALPEDPFYESFLFCFEV